MGFEWAVQSSDYYVSIYCQFHDVFVYTVWRCSWVAMLVLCIYCTAIFPQRLLVLAKQAAQFLNYYLLLLQQKHLRTIYTVAMVEFC